MPIPLTAAYTATTPRAAARASKNAGQTRRLLALAAIDDGATRIEAAMSGGVTLQIVRDWVVKRNAHGPNGLIDRKGGARARSCLTDTARRLRWRSRTVRSLTCTASYAGA